MIRTLLIFDTPGWACESECRAIRKHLELNAPGGFDCTLSPCTSAATATAYDLVVSTIYYHFEEAVHLKSIAEVSSYSYWIRKGWEGGWPHLKQWKHIVAKNAHIHSLLTAEDHLDVTLLYHPFDHDFFSPQAGPAHSRFRIGFAGHRDQELKGLKLIRAAVADLPDVELVTMTWEDGKLAHDSMPNFYRSLDAYVCMSKAGQDAGPRSPIEAGLCGVPVITTSAGQIGEMAHDGRNALVIERNSDALRAANIRLRDDHVTRMRLGAAARATFLNEWIIPTGVAWTRYLQRIAEQP